MYHVPLAHEGAYGCKSENGDGDNMSEVFRGVKRMEIV